MDKVMARTLIFIFLLMCFRAIHGSHLRCEAFWGTYKCEVTNITEIETRHNLLPLLDSPVSSIADIVTITIETGLGISELGIDRIPAEIFSMYTNLQQLTIKSEIREITLTDFKDALKLQRLNLPSNQLTRLTKGIFQSMKLQKLGLSHNKIEAIDDFTFISQSSLHTLALQSNRLTIIRRHTFIGLSKLRFLRLNGNEIHTIEDGGLDLPQLEVLFLFNNRLKTLGNMIFARLYNIKAIHLEHNELDNIGNSLYSLTKLQFLNLDENRISNIDLLKLAKLPKLRELDLRSSGVSLKSVKRDAKLSFDSPLKYLDLSNNNFTDSEDLTVLDIFRKLRRLYLCDNLFGRFNSSDEIKKKYLPNSEILTINFGLVGNDCNCTKIEDPDYPVEHRFTAMVPTNICVGLKFCIEKWCKDLCEGREEFASVRLHWSD